MMKATRFFRCAVPVCAALMVAGAAGAQTTAEREVREAKQDTSQAARSTGNAVKDSWITMKVHSQFVPEDALEDSDIDVDTSAGVVTLTGVVASEAGRTRAVAIAKATDGVKNVNDRLRVDTARMDDDARDATARTGAAAREGARDVKETGRSAGRAMSDGWVTSKIYAQFIDESALSDSDIDVDVNAGVVTLTGTAVSEAGVSRAAAIAKATEGVKSVNNKLRVGAEK